MPDDNLTVVMLNWRRPGNVAKLVPAYLLMPIVQQVILFDCDTVTRQTPLLPYANPKFLYVHADKDPGLVARFAAAGLARTNNVLLVDDDIMLPETTVNALHHAHYQACKSGVSGIFGRQINAEGVYVPKVTVHGLCDVVLTRAAIASRWLCCLALEHVHEMVKEIGGDPYGNGEDIVLSYVAMREHHYLNSAYRLPYRNMTYDDEHAISVRYPQHAAHRTKVVQWCRKNIYDPAKIENVFSADKV